MVGNPVPDDTPYERGLAYLRQVASLALEPGMVYVPSGLSDRIHLSTWVGHHIEAINARLSHDLHRCHQCFYPHERRTIQILAAPIADGFGIDGCCNIRRIPITIVLDVGRVKPKDWLGLVVHEYAHAYLGHPGHQQDFVNVLTHLCLGLGLPTPPSQVTDTYLRHWPHCEPTTRPLDFWMGR